MDKKIEWIKGAVSLCMDTSGNIAAVQSEFRKLEKIYEKLTAEEQREILYIMETQFEADDMVYVLSCFIRYMDIDDFKKAFVRLLCRQKYDCYTGSALEYQALAMKNTINGFHTEKKLLHKQNVMGFLKTFPVRFPYIRLSERNKKRIVIITEMLILNGSHSPSNIVMDVAYVLQEYLGYEVLLFVLPTNEVLPDNLCYLQLFSHQHDKFVNYAMRFVYRGVIFNGYQLSMDHRKLKEYDMMLSLIYAWNPIFVWNMGVRNPFADVPKQFTTVVSLEMDMRCPVSAGQILLRYGRLDAETEKEYEDTLEEGQRQVFLEEKWPTVVEKKGNETYSRSEVGLPEDKFLIVIVGSRLDSEINAEFVEVMQQIREKNDNVAFVFVGPDKNFMQLTDNNEMLASCIYWLGYQKDMMKILSVTDLYMNPKRIGGGVSALMALAAGIPVVTLPECDVAYNVRDNFIVQNYDEMVDEICRYVKDRTFYEQKKKDMEEIVNWNSLNNLGRYIEQLINKIETVIEEQEEKNDII